MNQLLAARNRLKKVKKVERKEPTGVVLCNLCAGTIDSGMVRYRCLECSDFDICADCFVKENHEHPCYSAVASRRELAQGVLEAGNNGTDLPELLRAALSAYETRWALGTHQCRVYLNP